MVSKSSSIKREALLLFGLSWPVILGQLGSTMMGVTDTLIVGQLGRGPLASVSLGHLFSFSLLVFGMGLLRGLDPFFAQAHGGADESRVSKTLIQAIMLAVVLSIPLSLLHLFAEPILRAFGQPESVIAGTGVYAVALIPGLMPTMVYLALTQALQGVGKMRAPMVIVLVANLVNVVLDYALVLGVPALSIPSLGVLGCGIATSSVRALMLVGLIAVCWPWFKEVWPQNLREVAQWKLVKQGWVVGFPVAVQSSLEAWAFGAMGLMMGLLGEVELAAHAVALNVATVTFMIPLGIGVAAATRVGHLVGRDEPWASTAWLAVGSAALWMLASGATLTFGAYEIASLYTDDVLVLGLCVGLLPVAGGFQLFDGIQASIFGVLRGAGDVQVPAWINVVGYWCLGLPFGYIAGVHLFQEPLLVWGGIAAALALISLAMLARLVVVLGRGATRVWDQTD